MIQSNRMEREKYIEDEDIMVDVDIDGGEGDGAGEEL